MRDRPVHRRAGLPALSELPVEAGRRDGSGPAHVASCGSGGSPSIERAVWRTCGARCSRLKENRSSSGESALGRPPANSSRSSSRWRRRGPMTALSLYWTPSRGTTSRAAPLRFASPTLFRIRIDHSDGLVLHLEDPRDLEGGDARRGLSRPLVDGLESRADGAGAGGGDEDRPRKEHSMAPDGPSAPACARSVVDSLWRSHPPSPRRCSRSGGPRWGWRFPGPGAGRRSRRRSA